MHRIYLILGYLTLHSDMHLELQVKKELVTMHNGTRFY
jgi:hypothetical protein